ncbi:MAG: transglutaminase domain-containing protein [Oscillospiraceae bacterium]
MKRSFNSVIAIALSICCLFCGCSEGGNNSSDASDSKEASFAGTQSVEEEPLSIQTPGGAVVVGKIDKDENGWYFAPERPLTVELTYYLDNPEHFEKLTRISMYDTSEDGMDKSVYQGETVTVTGMLQNYRGAGTLYLYPYKIERGKTVSESYAVPDLQYPDDDQAEYDPSFSVSALMAPIVENGHYVYNPYTVTQDTLEGMGNGFADFYVLFVDAWLEYKESCPCPDKYFAEMLSTVLLYEFPLFTADGKYDYWTDYDESAGVIRWSYTSSSKEEHDRLISDFKAAANRLLEQVDPNQSEQLRAQALYHAFCKSITYDYDVAESHNNVEAYYAYTKGRGVCTTFACALSQLFAQIGIESTVASGSTASGDGHVWNTVVIDGKMYFCDSTYELSWNDGSAYAYFGMTLQDRLNDGSGFTADGISIGTINIRSANEVILSDRTLQIK